MRRPTWSYVLAALLSLTLLPTALGAMERDYVLRWIPPEGSPIEGYRIQLSDESGASERVLDIGLVPADVDGIGRFTLVLPAETGSSITMTSYSGELESEPSNAIFVAASACAPATCDDGNECSADDCAAAGCSHAPLPDGTLCAGGDATCVAGTCRAVECLADADCDDGDLCNGAETCGGFACAASAPLACGEATQCAAPLCDRDRGCLMVAYPDGTSCDDGNAATRRDRCKSGVCAGSTKTTVGRKG